VVTYQPLDRKALEGILTLQLAVLRDHVRSRLGPAGFDLELSSRARKLLLSEGTSAEYGARELKRAIHRLLMQPLARQLNGRAIPAGSTVRVDTGGRRGALEFVAMERAA